MDFVGQERLLSEINGYSQRNMPHSILLIGEEGCGKRTIVKYIANRLNMELIELDSSTEADKIISCQQSALKSLYLIDLTKLRLDKDQNRFLKFVEEPSSNAYVVLTSPTDAGILPTIANRCVRLDFEPYTTEQLKQIKKLCDDRMYEVYRTPGQLASASEASFFDMLKLCETIVSKIGAASYSNTISVATKINYKDQYGKFDFFAFLRLLEKTAAKTYTENGSKTALRVYVCVADRLKKFTRNGSLAKEPFMISLLDDLWKETR